MTENHEKYHALISSIDFFSQNLHLDQIIEYGFSIFNEFKQPLKSAIYTLTNDSLYYEPRFSNRYDIELPRMNKKSAHDDFAVRNGFLLTSREKLMRYFEPDELETLSISMVMPLIIDDKLYGFIITSDAEDMQPDEVDFFNHFNYLMNLSLEKASRYLERAILRKEIDIRVFNINTLSHTMRVLLSELDTKTILQLSTDVIREITTCQVASIGLYDETEKKIIIRKYDDIFQPRDLYEDFNLKQMTIQSNQKTIFSVENDFDALEGIFEEPEKFKFLDAEYVVLLVKENIKGFVTISKSMTSDHYDINTLERIQDVASIMYIGLNNARQYETIAEQKELLKEHLNVLQRMNKIIKNVNSAETYDELCERIMDTLALTFGVEQSVLLTAHQGEIKCSGSVGLEADQINVHFETLKTLFDAKSERIEAVFTQSEVLKKYPESFVTLFEDMNCLITCPIKPSNYIGEPLGVIVVGKTVERLKQTQVIMIDLLANSVAPLMSQLKLLDQFRVNYEPKPSYVLNQIYSDYDKDVKLYEMDFLVWATPSDSEELPEDTAFSEQVVGVKKVNLGDIVVNFSHTELLEESDVTKPYLWNPKWEEVETWLENIRNFEA